MIALSAGLMLLVAVTGFAVVRTRDVTAQIISLGFYAFLVVVYTYLQEIVTGEVPEN